MRLIDADKIHWEYKCISKEEIDDEPTVKAIPIEWIKKQIDYWRKRAEDYAIRYADFPDMLNDAEIGVHYYENLIKDWEKENE